MGLVSIYCIITIMPWYQYTCTVSSLSCLYICYYLCLLLVQDAVKNINMASDTGKLSDLLRALQSDDANLEELNPQNLRWYLEVLNKTRKQNMEVYNSGCGLIVVINNSY